MSGGVSLVLTLVAIIILGLGRLLLNVRLLPGYRILSLGIGVRRLKAERRWIYGFKRLI
jgi:hypothetical protein